MSAESMTITLNVLAKAPFWVAWCNVLRNGKLTKMPYSPADGRPAKANDPRTWDTRSSAETRAKRIVNGNGGGIGLELTELVGTGHRLGGIDLDTCRDPISGVFEPWAQQVIARFSSYTEVSPSNTGAKVFFKYAAADLPGLRAAMGTEHSRSWTCGNGKDHPPAIELHLGNRYFAVTEDRLDESPEELRLVDAADILWIINEAGPTFIGNGKAHRSPDADRGAKDADEEDFDAQPQDADEDTVSIALLLKQLPAKLRNAITKPTGDRSKALCFVIRALGERGCSKSLIKRIIESNAVGEKYADRSDLDEEIDRVLKKQTRAARPDWHDHLIVGEGDKPKSNLANAITALSLAPEWQGALAFNEFAQRIELHTKTPWLPAAPPKPVNWITVDDIRTADWLQHQGIFVSSALAGEAVYLVACRRQYHPVRDYLTGLVWDGESRLDRWCCTYLGAEEDTDYTRAVGARFLIGAIARVMDPGCKSDCTLVIEGPQGALKSTAVLTLMPDPEWFTDELSEPGSKDAALQLAGRWIVEISELDSLSRAEVSRIKAYMSRTTDRFRPPYGRHVIGLPRQCEFFGTVNHDEYLRDETGGRRFWPIRCGKIAITALRHDRDQLWAEALHRFNAGEKWWLDTRELTTAAEREQRERHQADAWQPVIAEYLKAKASVTVGEVLKDALFLTTDKWGQSEQNRVARCLIFEKWKRSRKRLNANDLKNDPDKKDREYRYYPPAADG